MIKRLYIKNFTLISEAEIFFDSGFNVLTGETGAGKSIIINAIRLLLGLKAESSIVRNTEESALIEGDFEITPQVTKRFKKLEVPIENNQITIMRQINKNGRNRILLNDEILPLSLLKSIGEELIDIHGQHQHQSLFNEKFHIEAMDGLAPYQPILLEYRTLYQKYITDLKAYRNLEKQHQESVELKKQYRSELTDLRQQNLQIDEDRQLHEQIKILTNIEKLTENSNLIYSEIYENDRSVISQLEHYQRLAQEVADIDEEMKNNLEIFESTIMNLEEIGRNFMSYKDKIEHHPEELKQCEQRLSELEKLTFKYNKSINELIEYQNEIEKSINSIDISNEKLGEKQKGLELLEKNLIKKAKELSEMRQKFANVFEKQITSKMQSLGMKTAEFKVEFLSIENPVVTNFDQIPISPTGLESLHFLIKTNSGNNFLPLNKIASGGEASRIMLALKSILAESSLISTLIFDEIDTGISGRIAEIVGKEMKNLSTLKQIICITHLHQIASLSNEHFVVLKKVQGGQTYSLIKKLNYDEKVMEIAKLMAGETVSEASINHAKEILSASI